jgi:hypothetical protein
LNHVLDHQQAEYSEFEIQRSVGLWGLPLSSSRLFDRNMLKLAQSLSPFYLRKKSMVIVWTQVTLALIAPLRCDAIFVDSWDTWAVRVSVCTVCKDKNHLGCSCHRKKIWRVKTGTRQSYSVSRFGNRCPLSSV